MNVERLTKLAKLLESHNGFRVVKVRGREMVFNMDQWRVSARQLANKHGGFNCVDSKGLIARALARNECGTACCAIGLAAQTPWFNRQGFKLAAGPRADHPTYQGMDHWDAVRAFFGLNEDQAHHLFMRSSYKRMPLPSEVAARIRSVIPQTPM